MKCNNCGWINQDESNCIKCGAPLVQSTKTGQGEIFKGTIQGQQTGMPAKTDPPQSQKNRPDTYLKETANVNIQPGNKMINCPECGYLSSAQVINCPKCGSILEPTTAKENTVQVQKPITREGNITVSPIAPFSGTIDPYRQKIPAKKEIFLLRLESREEDNELLSFEATGDDLELNRANLDNDNKGITAKLQATLSSANNTWYIQDQSEFKTTFIQVAEKHELKNGDILLIGSKKFIFYTEEPNL